MNSQHENFMSQTFSSECVNSLICTTFRDPGEEFELFNRHSNQTYTVLKLGEWERRTLPLSNVQRLWSAFNDAVISNPPPMEPSCKLTNKVNGG